MRASIFISTFVLCASASATDLRYFLEPITSEPAIESSDSKTSVAYNVVHRVGKVCGYKFTDDRMMATGRVQIHVLQLKKVGGGSRFLVGPFRGNSVITLRVTVFDVTGKEIVNKRLERKGNWFLGSVTIGATDNKMLTHIAQDVCSQL